MKWLIRLFLSIHVFVYRLSGGKFGGKIGGAPVLLLTSTGRKSGKTRTIPVAYLRDGENYVITASNGGAAQHPGWYFNLKHNPKATIQVNDRAMAVLAEQAENETRSRLWSQLIQQAPAFEKYGHNTQRVIPMFILRPAG